MAQERREEGEGVRGEGGCCQMLWRGEWDGMGGCVGARTGLDAGSECGGVRPARARVIYMASVCVWIECTAAADTWVCVRSYANMKEANVRYV